MGADAWLVLATVVAVVAIAATDRVPTVAAMGAGVAFLLVVGAVDDEVALSGLSSPATATIALLYVVAGGVAATGALSWFIDRLLFGRTRTIVRLAGATAAMSAFVPNTPLVALAAPRAIRWSRANDRSASTLLMPLSFASILGGVITLLGTSTNLVVSDAIRATGDDPLGMFEVTRVGLPVAVVGIVVLAVATPFLLRHRTAAGESMRATAREFQLQMVVAPGGAIDGKTIAAAGLRHLDGVYLAAIERGGAIVTARPETKVTADDRLYFVGDVTRIIDLQDVAGLRSAEEPHVIDAEGPGTRLYEAVVGPRSDLAGRTLKDAGFRGRYGAAVLAVHRADEELRGKLGAIPIAAGDVLLVLAGDDFGRRWREHGDFALVSSVEEPPPPRRARAWVAAASFVGLIVAAASGALSLLAASALAAAVMVVGGVLGPSEARRAVDLNVVLTIAMSISLGNAAAASGLAAEIASGLVDLGASWGTFGLLLLTIVATQLLTEVLSNSGAAALMVPIAMAAASGTGGDPRDFAIAVLVGASCSFLTPIGYQTNLMVYGLGGYRFGDFTRLGFPLTVSSALVTAAVLSL
ncbi:MAG: SLC13 family permease [Acidimicrobiaceae bacterium]|nr:SLC13 family permease [Acidimicrobiaceae bacterium]